MTNSSIAPCQARHPTAMVSIFLKFQILCNSTHVLTHAKFDLIDRFLPRLKLVVLAALNLSIDFLPLIQGHLNNLCVVFYTGIYKYTFFNYFSSKCSPFPYWGVSIRRKHHNPRLATLSRLRNRLLHPWNWRWRWGIFQSKLFLWTRWWSFRIFETVLQ